MKLSKINHRLQQVRNQMKVHSIDAWIVPSTDPHNSEYFADHWKCREWISGFTGSAGIVVVTAGHAGLWTDSRYFVQAEEELSNSEFVLHKQQVQNAPEHESWLLQNLAEGATVAYDGNLISVSAFDRIVERLDAHGLELETDLAFLDEVWTDRPALPANPIYEHAAGLAGMGRSEKLAQIREDLEAASLCSTYLVTALDDIAWSLNLRGSDVEFNPAFYAYLLVQPMRAVLFANESQIPKDLIASLNQDGVQVRAYHELGDFLSGLPEDQPIFLDESSTSVAVMERMAASEFDAGSSLIAPLKGIKNETEIGHIRKVMEKDGVALLKLYRWLEAEMKTREVTEVDVAFQLDQFRSQQANYVGESFPAIAAYGANGALPHYRPMPESCATLKPEGVFLLDSGGQYLDGTTDVTRTIALGTPTPEQKKHFTLVLKGHIAVGSFRFPNGTKGYHLDSFARQFLWREGLDYGHGTGHGVGFFMNVHEGPQSIRSAASGSGSVPMLPGMVTSNEPGYYQEGDYGIRIENLVLTVEDGETEYGHFFAFEDLTLFPMDKTLIDFDLLSPSEIAWLDNYHQMVWSRLSPLLDEEEKAWLKERC